MPRLTSSERPRVAMSLPRAGAVSGEREGWGRWEAPLEPLEQRTLMSFYAAQGIVESLGLDRSILDFVVPAEVEGSEVVGFGAAAAALGDIDGDGKGDFAIAAPGRAAAGDLPEVPGVVLLYSGATGELIRALRDGFHEFGAALANVGDLNGDGAPDLLVGSPRAASDLIGMERGGAVYAFSGADGSVLWAHGGDAVGAEFGRSVALIGDTDGDGVGDVAVGAPGAGSNGEGQVTVHTGATGEIRLTLTGNAAGDRFGQAVAGAPDRSWGTTAGDGVPDVVVGAPGADHEAQGVAYENGGAISVWSGADGTKLSEAPLLLGGAEAGTSLAVLRREPGAETPFSIMVGAPGAAGYYADSSGGVYMTDGGRLEQPTIFAEPGNTRLGEVLVNLGDIDGDLREDLAVVSTLADGRRRLTLWSPRGYGGLVLYRRVEPEPPNFSAYTTMLPGLLAIAAGVDADGDGLTDLATAGRDEEGVLRVRVVSALSVLGLPQVTGWSKSLTHLYANPSSHYYDGVGWAAGFMIINGVFRPYTSLPGLGDVYVSGVSDNGLIVGYLRRENSFYVEPDWTKPFIYRDGVRTLLADAVTSITGPTNIDFSAVTFVGVGNGGEVLLTEQRPWAGWDNPDSVPRAWVFKDGRLRFLWTGAPQAVNASGTVLGTTWSAPFGAGTTVTWHADTGVVELRGIWNATDINDHGFVVGTDAQNDLAIWDGRKVREIADQVWRPAGIDNDGRALATRHDPRLGLIVGIIGLDESVRVLTDLVVSARKLDGPVTPAAFTPGGDLLVYTTGYEQVILRRLSPVEAFTAAAGSPRAAAAGRGGMLVTTYNTLGGPAVFWLDPDPRPGESRWQGRSLVPLQIGTKPATDAAAFTDPKDGRMYVAVATADGLALAVVTDNGSLDEVRELSPNDLAGTEIVGRLTVFTGADGLVRIAGINGAGELLLYEQTGQRVDPSDRRSPFQWSFTNLTRTDLAPHGDATPAWVGELTTLVTPWNGLTIAGLDAAGNIQVVWWAPGQERWQTDNLSQTAGAPPLTGRLAPYVTPWGGMNIAGTEAGTGELSVTWWVPGFGPKWENDRLTEEAGGPQLAPESLVAFVTPWGTLHVAGNDALTGEAIIYWWAPEQSWRADPFPLRNQGETQRPVADLVPLVNGSNLNLFGRAENGHVVRLFWNPGDGGMWNIEDLTGVVGEPVA